MTTKVKTKQSTEKSVATVAAHNHVEELLKYNQAFLNHFVKHPLIKHLLQTKQLTKKTRDIFSAWFEQFATHFQTMLFTRQSACVDPNFNKIFLTHLQDEFGHDEIFSRQAKNEKSSFTDPIIEALLTWFIHRMLVSDNVEKAALIHLILETGADHFFDIVNKTQLFSDYVVTGYIKLHLDVDEGHATMINGLLSNQHPDTYVRLKEVLKEGWSMLNAMFSRVLTLIEKANTNTEEFHQETTLV